MCLVLRSRPSAVCTVVWVVGGVGLLFEIWIVDASILWPHPYALLFLEVCLRGVGALWCGCLFCMLAWPG